MVQGLVLVWISGVFSHVGNCLADACASANQLTGFVYELSNYVVSDIVVTVQNYHVVPEQLRFLLQLIVVLLVVQP